MFLIYNLLSLIALVVYFPLLLFKKGPENRRAYLSERLGISKYTNADVWIHAVSVGEVIAALPFLKALKNEIPGRKIVLSTTTYTGQKVARQRFTGADRIMYMPWDASLSINRAVKLMRPEMFITVETELWPVLFRSLKKAGSRIIILNGRISPGSFRGYKKIRTFMRRVLSHIDYLYMQGEVDAERITTMGADENKVGIMGNFKFDVEIEKGEPIRWLDHVDGQILLAGSTHKGEEEIILDAYETVKKSYSELKLLIAPRHPERFNEVEEILKTRGLSFCRRSQIRTQITEPAYRTGRHRSQNNEYTEKLCYPTSSHEVSGAGRTQTDIILLDTIGELSRLYSRAEVTIIGGSLIPFGGHNILEPAFWSKPILFGPHMDNFPFAEEFLDDSAALMVKNSTDIAAAVKGLLEDSEKAKQLGQKAKAILERNTGAVNRALEIVRGFLGNT